jgi:hypothetical protein
MNLFFKKNNKKLNTKNDYTFPNATINEIRRKASFVDKSYELAQKQPKADLGIEIDEVGFDQFERRKTPRVASVNFGLLI